MEFARPVQRSVVRRGFTVVEILVVLGIVIGVISTLIVGLGYGARRARIANTEFLMNSIVVGLKIFSSETGYMPPILGVPSQVGSPDPGTPFGQLGWCRDLLWRRPLTSPPPPTGGGPDYASWSATDRQNLQKWCSATTIPEYLLGLGDRSQDGYGVIMEGTGALPTNTNTPGYREQPALGIRNPGSDGGWGSLLNPRPTKPGKGRFDSRNLASDVPATGNADSTSAFLRGKSLGPYLEVKSDSEIGGLTGFQSDGTPIVAKPGEINNFDLAPKCLLDFFGKPIIYYRRGYLNGDPRATDRSWSLADIVALRPQRFNPGEDVNAMPDANNDSGASRDALSSEFALLSFGPDQRWNPTIRADTEGYNEDNIVRFGP
jgi:type II secretory pathway pseudopilin PulG